ncbi:hypothetical protein Tco_0559037 [Tanacetum coccineum]
MVSDNEDDAEDSSKQGRKIDEIDQDPNISLVLAGMVQDVNIKYSFTKLSQKDKGKGKMGNLRVHHVSTKDRVDICMLVEREYPLSRGVLTQMLSAKLLVEQNNEISRELLRKIFMQAEKDQRRCSFFKFLVLEEYSQRTGLFQKIDDLKG